MEQLLVQVLLWVQMSQMNLKLIKLQQEAQDHGKNLDGLGAQLKILNLRHQVLRVIYNKLYLSQSTAGVLKLWIFPFLMEFGFFKLEFGNQIGKFMCKCVIYVEIFRTIFKNFILFGVWIF